jgi:hypothetical protein
LSAVAGGCAQGGSRAAEPPYSLLGPPTPSPPGARVLGGASLRGEAGNGGRPAPAGRIGPTQQPRSGQACPSGGLAARTGRGRSTPRGARRLGMPSEARRPIPRPAEASTPGPERSRRSPRWDLGRACSRLFVLECVDGDEGGRSPGPAEASTPRPGQISAFLAAGICGGRVRGYSYLSALTGISVAARRAG